MRSVIKSLMAGCFGLAAGLGGLAASAATVSTISNIATITWDSGASRVGTSSNRVDIIVDRTPPKPEPATLTAYQLNASTTGGVALSVPQTMCKGASGEIPVELGGVYSDVALSPANVKAASAIRAGEPLIVQIDSKSDNLDPAAIDTMLVKLSTPSGDAEQVRLSETAANSARFVGIIRTVPTPPALVVGDCALSVRPGDTINLAGTNAASGTKIGNSEVEILIDPFGIVFDSGDGEPISGARVTLINTTTGLPAEVFGDDGKSIFPNSVITGSTVTDSSGAVYQFPKGDYRFPFARAGNYKLIVEPPVPYTTPSAATPAELAGFKRPDGEPYTIVDGSYSKLFVLNSPAPVRIDIPADKPGGALILSKVASSSVATMGDGVQYRVTVSNPDASRSTGAVTITDTLPYQMRLRPDTVRYNGAITPYTITPDGKVLTVVTPALRAGASGLLTYLLEVRPDAQPGNSLNRAIASDKFGAKSDAADATVRITRDAIADRMTLIGRVTDGGCTVDDKAANGVPGVRVMLEDGSYAVTDIEGRYHFEGLVPGDHVVQIEPSSLPSDQVPADCVRNARSGGSAISRFITGQGGALLRADFRTVTGVNAARPDAEKAKRPAPASDSEAAGADRNWFEDQTPSIKWLFPEVDHNPRTKAVRVAIRHLPGQKVSLLRNGKPVEDLSFDGTTKNGLGSVAVSLWRAVSIEDNETRFTAEVRDAKGNLVETLNRSVHFSTGAMRAEFIREKSLLVADGVTRPVLALRMLDRDGKPIHKGVVGDFSVPAPYYPAVEADAQAARGLSGLERGRPVWRVDGDDGIAYVELEPTTASGALTLSLPFRDKDVQRTQRIEAWLTPGNRPWTVVGFASGTVGFNTLEGRMENLNDSKSEKLTDGRLALYAKGKVKGQWLMTLAYDSDKKADDTRFGGVIDPTAYYTIYADRSERRYDAASVRKLYVRLERPQFYALFGDYETAINDPQLTRYNRSLNGVKGEFQSENVTASAFAADTPYSHRREEIQGNGLTGPYALSSRDVLANSERVVIETRDRLRSNKIIDTQTLVRHIDYDIDYNAGTLRFREPVLSRSSALDPQFIVVDYEVDGVAQRVTNAGGRARWNNDKRTLAVGATLIHDETDAMKTNAGGIDVRYTPSTSTEVRAELAMSDQSAKNGSSLSAGNATAWLVEAEHHGAKYDVLAYAREQQNGYGVGQTNAGENGTRKLGVDGRIRFSEKLSFAGSAWNEDALNSNARRQAGRGLIEYRGAGLDSRAGLTVANDRLDDGSTVTSTIAQIGATKRFFNNKLELDAQTEMPLDQKGGSIDFPARHRLGARVAVTDDVTLVGSYELADGKDIEARTARVGFDVKPWSGARFLAAANQQSTDEYGPRSFASYGFAQSLPVGKRMTVDFSLDGNKTLGGIDPARVLNKEHPVSSGGFLGSDNTLTEDFTAVTTGASYRGQDWSMAGRAEYRDGTTTDRYGFNMSALRQIGEGRAFGGAMSWFRASENGGATTEAASIALSWAHRPDDSRIAFLEKLELRSDKVTGAVAGQSGPIGGAPLTVNGDAKSQRIINSFSINWSPSGRRDDEYLTRSELSLFWGSRYNFDRFGADDLKGWSNILGVDGRLDIGRRLDLGLSGTVRQNPGARSYSFSGGPTIGISPFKNSYVTLGYNVIGFRDRDYEASRYTRKGLFVTFRLKFDQDSFADLGLGARDSAKKADETKAVAEAPMPVAVPMPDMSSADLAAMAMSIGGTSTDVVAPAPTAPAPVVAAAPVAAKELAKAKAPAIVAAVPAPTRVASLSGHMCPSLAEAELVLPDATLTQAANLRELAEQARRQDRCAAGQAS